MDSDEGWKVARSRQPKNRPQKAAKPRVIAPIAPVVVTKPSARAYLQRKAAAKIERERYMQRRKIRNLPEFEEGQFGVFKALDFSTTIKKKEPKSQAKPKKTSKQGSVIFSQAQCQNIVNQVKEAYPDQTTRRLEVITEKIATTLKSPQFKEASPITSLSKYNRFIGGSMEMFPNDSLAPLARFISSIDSEQEIISFIRKLITEMNKLIRKNSLEKIDKAVSETMIQVIVRARPSCALAYFEKYFEDIFSLNPNQTLPFSVNGKTKMLGKDYFVAELASNESGNAKSKKAAKSSSSSSNDEKDKVEFDQYLTYDEKMAFFIAGQLNCPSALPSANSSSSSTAKTSNQPLNHSLPLFFRYLFPLAASPHSPPRLRLCYRMVEAHFCSARDAGAEATDKDWLDAVIALSGDTGKDHKDSLVTQWKRLCAKTRKRHMHEQLTFDIPRRADVITAFYLKHHEYHPPVAEPSSKHVFVMPYSFCDVAMNLDNPNAVTMSVLAILHSCHQFISDSQRADVATRCLIHTVALSASLIEQQRVAVGGHMQRLLMEWIMSFATCLPEDEDQETPLQVLANEIERALPRTTAQLKLQARSTSSNASKKTGETFPLSLVDTTEPTICTPLLHTLLWILNFFPFILQEMNDEAPAPAPVPKPKQSSSDSSDSAEPSSEAGSEDDLPAESEVAEFLDNNGADWHEFGRRMHHILRKVYRPEFLKRKNAEEEKTKAKNPAKGKKGAKAVADEEEEAKGVDIHKKEIEVSVTVEVEAALLAMRAASKVVELTEDYAVVTKKMEQADAKKQKQLTGKGDFKEHDEEDEAFEDYDAEWSDYDDEDDYDDLFADESDDESDANGAHSHKADKRKADEKSGRSKSKKGGNGFCGFIGSVLKMTFSFAFWAIVLFAFHEDAKTIVVTEYGKLPPHIKEPVGEFYSKVHAYYDIVNRNAYAPMTNFVKEKYQMLKDNIHLSFGAKQMINTVFVQPWQFLMRVRKEVMHVYSNVLTKIWRMNISFWEKAKEYAIAFMELAENKRKTWNVAKKVNVNANANKQQTSKNNDKNNNENEKGNSKHPKSAKSTVHKTVHKTTPKSRRDGAQQKRPVSYMSQREDGEEEEEMCTKQGACH
ncbi:uncharacterized protein MONOS_5663 [Monocercomonoides exilis]|uniref:uncharacterized protein n=1 Tax=Monocercomonoides exilis TaxID=2049356 RepID=UPI00355A4E43|nr:hypothetical protein MONOS_5663 [Monocercomonoides exilis]|eukprot:MONOS_5663.1-p1 / transcript=MONOS_5663.1 / gene=MONOS_5663 / organism=Monocercomonoides_exilis_PA203 / gene_product=unspecified product / transcript_product=unspecified product / location=Mono_scaffold00167:88544-91935(-) / protein_length=1113 / sequence_SO=supercontig / SO=protein_coding / is_pseudo=false